MNLSETFLFKLYLDYNRINILELPGWMESTEEDQILDHVDFESVFCL